MLLLIKYVRTRVYLFISYFYSKMLYDLKIETERHYDEHFGRACLLVLLHASHSIIMSPPTIIYNDLDGTEVPLI